MKDIRKVRDGKMFLGICTGLARKFDVNVWIFRAIFLVGSSAVGAAFWVYVAMYFLMGDYE